MHRGPSTVSLGAGQRWAVAGWSRYTARRSFVARAATRPAERSRWSSSAEPRGTSMLRAYRDHSKRTLGVGPRRSAAGWSRYAITSSLALAVSTTRPAEALTGRVVGSAEGRGVRRRIETTPSGRWGLARAGPFPSGLDTSGLRKLVLTTRPAEGLAGRLARSREERACSARIETAPSGRWGSTRAEPLPDGLDTRHGAPSSRVPLLDQRNGPAGRVARSREERACSGRIETTPSGRWGLARADPLPGGLDTPSRARWRSPCRLLDQRKPSLVE